MKTQITILLLGLFFICKSQDTLSTFNESLLGTWILTKTELVDRGGGGTIASESKFEIIIKTGQFIQINLADTSWTENYSLELINNNNQMDFSFTSDALSGLIAFHGPDRFVISNYPGGCGSYHYYERVKTAYNKK